jgi:hypothetical protein
MAQIIPFIFLNDAEQTIVNEHLSDPTVKKYFRSLAYQNITDIILGSPDINESAESYLRRQAVVKGRLEVIETLLSIQEIKKVL